MSSRHKGVSCDACMWSGFRFRRYKCLICYDYDLCGPCFDSGRETGTHSTRHPMQCLLTKSDYKLFYGSDSNTNDGVYSYTCPLCGTLGYTEGTLIDHVTTSHGDSSDNVSDQLKVICPVCVGLQTNYTSRQKTEFVRHMNMEHHRAGSNQYQTSEQNGEPSFERRGHFARRGMPRARDYSSNLRGQSSISGSHNGSARGSTSNASIDQQTQRTIQRRNVLAENFPSDGNSFNVNSIEPLGEIISQLRQARSRSGLAMGSQFSQLEQQFTDQLQSQQPGSSRAVAQRLANESAGSMPSIDLLSLLDSGNVLANVEGGSDAEDEPILRVLVQGDPVLLAEHAHKNHPEQRRRPVESSERSGDASSTRSTLDQLIVSAMNNPVALRRLDSNLNNNAGDHHPSDAKTAEKKLLPNRDESGSFVIKLRDNTSLLENLTALEDSNSLNDQDSGLMSTLIREQHSEPAHTNSLSKPTSSFCTSPPKEAPANSDSHSNDLSELVNNSGAQSRQYNEALYLQEIMLSSFLHSRHNLAKEMEINKDKCVTDFTSANNNHLYNEDK